MDNDFVVPGEVERWSGNRDAGKRMQRLTCHVSLLLSESTLSCGCVHDYVCILVRFRRAGKEHGSRSGDAAIQGIC